MTKKGKWSSHVMTKVDGGTRLTKWVKVIKDKILHT